LPAPSWNLVNCHRNLRNLVEHPQLVADRILRYAPIVGRENVIAGTDCGLCGRVHADLA
jgi:5-methyltetrahydropteroyltriglutamate--homocysteine methyltransferase